MMLHQGLQERAVPLQWPQAWNQVSGFDGFWGGFFVSYWYILLIYSFILLINVFFSFSFTCTLLHVLCRQRERWVLWCSKGQGLFSWLDEKVPRCRFGLGFLWAQAGICCSCVLWADSRWMEGKSPPMSCCPASRRALRPQLSKLSQGMPVSEALMSSDFFMPLIFSPCLSWLTFVCSGPCLLALHLWGARSSAVFSCQPG